MVNPADYVSSNDLQKERAWIIINEFAKDLKNMSGKCMDAGCGPGNITKDILLLALDPNAIIIGTDISKEMIEYANRMYSDKERLKFEILNIQTKDVPREYMSEFNHIFSFHMLHLCSDIRRAFENIYCMLRPSGTMLISLVSSHDAVYKVFKIMARDVRFAPYMQDQKKYIGPFYHSVQPHKDLKDLLENIGFRIHHCSCRQMKIETDSNNFLLSLTSMMRFLDDMPYNRREEFKNDFKREYENMKIKLYSNRQRDNKEEIIPDFHTLLIAYAQKDVS